MKPRPNTELDRIEREYPEGLTLAQIFSCLQTLEIKLSEPTFRKYVQLGLLARSRRVGQKGKHKGSQGVYPVSTVRRILEIKALMEEDLTLEEIATRVLRFRAHLDRLDETLGLLFSSFEESLRTSHFSDEVLRSLAKDVETLDRLSTDLLSRAKRIESRFIEAGKSQIQQEATPIIGLRRA